MRHTRADIALAVGAASLLVPLLAPPAWIYASRTVRFIDAGTESGSRERAATGRLLAKFATVLLVLWLYIIMFTGTPLPAGD